MDDGIEERKRIRRERIQRQQNQSTNESDGKPLLSKETESKNLKSAQQIVDASLYLATQKADVITKVTTYRVDAEYKENGRRIAEESIRYQRECMVQSNIANEDSAAQVITKAWSGTINSNDPQELHNKMEGIKSLYDDFFSNNDAVSDKLKLQLKEKDDEYLHSLNAQGRVICDLREVTDVELRKMMCAHADELSTVEDIFIEDRRLLIKSQASDIHSLFQKKHNAGAQHLVAIQYRRDESQGMIAQSQEKVINEYNHLRNKLEAEVRRLQCELEASRTMYQVNADQIGYDYRLLANKNTTDGDKVKKRRKRVIVCKEELNKTLEQASLSESHDQKRNSTLEQDCVRLEGQYTSLVSKLNRFKMLEDQKLSSVLAMHQEELDALLTRIKVADKNISQTFFGCSQSYIDVQIDCAQLLERDERTGRSFESEKTDTTFKSWNHLEKMLIQYRDAFEQKENTSEKNQILKTKNDKLQNELSRLLQDEINSELISPPFSPST